MRNEETLRHLVQALGATTPDAVHTTVIRQIETGLGGSAVVDILLVDYEQRSLRSVSWPNVVPMDGTAAGRAYLENSVVSEASQLWVPLDAHGACLGVLSVVKDGLTDSQRSDVIDCANVVARALVTAERTTDAFRRARRKDRMTLAAELQWTLLPGRGLAGPSFTVAGQLEPAMSVRGDSYDWSINNGELSVVACNGMGEGTSAALLTALTLAALRNGRRSGLGFEEQLALANDSVWAQHGGKQYSEAVVLSINTRNGRAHVVDAGSPRLYRLRSGRCAQVELEAQLPLGMFDGTRYTPQLINLRAGDRLVLVSDGALPPNDSSGGAGLIATITRTAAMTPTAVVRALIEDVWTVAGTQDLTDDAVVVCLDWHG